MKKKILTLFLAFAIMMTFMPSMAFAGDYDELTVYVGIAPDSSFCTLSSNAPNGTVENGKFEFFKDGERECYCTTSGVWFDNNDSQMQTEPESLYATDYSYAIVSGEVSGEYTQATSVWLSYGPDPSEGTLQLSQQTPATEMNRIVFWLDEGKIHFSFYIVLPPSEAIGEQINEVNVSFEVVDNGKEYSIVDLLDSYLYETGYVVLDEKGISMNPNILKGGNYVIEYTLKAKDDNYFANDGLGTYTGVINALNGGNQSTYGAAKVEDDGKTLTFDVPFAIGGGNDSNNFGKIAIIAAAVAGVAAVVGVVVKNVQNAAMMQQAAFQAKMQQQMVQKQVATIKTVLKGAGVVFSLASFGSSLGKLFQLNQFGFNPFGFR